MENLTLQHHGVKGMKWGVRRFQNKNGSLTPIGRLRRKRYEKQLAKQRIENLEKARQARAAKKEHEANKQKVLQSGSANEVLKYKGELTQQEMDTVLRRIQWEQNMQSISSREVSAGKSKVNKMMTTIGDLTTNANTVIKAYNTVANVVNAFNTGTMLPKISTNITEGNRKEYKAEKKEQKKAADAKKKRAEQEAQRESKHQERAEKKAAKEKEASTNNKSSGPKVDFDKVKSAANAASKAYDAYKNTKKSSGPEVVTGEVIGEGKSKRQSNSSNKSKPAGYYDPIDMEGSVSSVKNTESAAIGQDYVTYLLEDKS